MSSYVGIAPAQNSLGEILVAEAPNDKPSARQLSKFDNVADYKSKTCSQSWPCDKPVRQIVAFDVGWVILHTDGSVATLGDPRYGDCLGREITADRYDGFRCS